MHLATFNSSNNTIDCMRGFAGNDTLNGEVGIDYLDSGKGDDRIIVGENDGTGIASLLFNQGDGNDTIAVVKRSRFNLQSRNTNLIFGGNINPASLTFSYSTRVVENHSPFSNGLDYTVTDLTIHYGTQGDSIVVENGLDATAFFEFADGRRFSYWQMGLFINGLAGATIGSGGGTSATAYQYNAGSGSQVINNNIVAGGGRVSAVSFGTGITPSMVSLGLGSLLLRMGTNGDELHIADFNPAGAGDDVLLGVANDSNYEIQFEGRMAA